MDDLMYLAAVNNFAKILVCRAYGVQILDQHTGVLGRPARPWYVLVW